MKPYLWGSCLNCICVAFLTKLDYSLIDHECPFHRKFGKLDRQQFGIFLHSDRTWEVTVKAGEMSVFCGFNIEFTICMQFACLANTEMGFSFLFKKWWKWISTHHSKSNRLYHPSLSIASMYIHSTSNDQPNLTYTSSYFSRYVMIMALTSGATLVMVYFPPGYTYYKV